MLQGSCMKSAHFPATLQGSRTFKTCVTGPNCRSRIGIHSLPAWKTGDWLRCKSSASLYALTILVRCPSSSCRRGLAIRKALSHQLQVAIRVRLELPGLPVEQPLKARVLAQALPQPPELEPTHRRLLSPIQDPAEVKDHLRSPPCPPAWRRVPSRSSGGRRQSLDTR